VAKTIALRFRSIDELMAAGIEELTAIREIGPKIASSIISYFSDSENIEIIKRLKSSGIRLAGETGVQSAGSLLSGKTILISGVFKVHSAII
jgi:DNA ligase (NAD+)